MGRPGDRPGGRSGRALAERLPGYLVPAAFVALDALPLTVNGKLDRAALPAPDTDRAPVAAVDGEPAALATLRGLYAEVLNLAAVGADEDFFTLGGDSIIAIQLVNRARRAGLRITPRDVFLHRTPRRAGRADRRRLRRRSAAPIR